MTSFGPISDLFRAENVTSIYACWSVDPGGNLTLLRYHNIWPNSKTWITAAFWGRIPLLNHHLGFNWRFGRYNLPKEHHPPILYFYNILFPWKSNHHSLQVGFTSFTFFYSKGFIMIQKEPPFLPLFYMYQGRINSLCWGWSCHL